MGIMVLVFGIFIALSRMVELTKGACWRSRQLAAAANTAANTAASAAAATTVESDIRGISGCSSCCSGAAAVAAAVAVADAGTSEHGDPNSVSISDDIAFRC